MWAFWKVKCLQRYVFHNAKNFKKWDTHKVDFSFFLMFICYSCPIIAYGMPSIYTIAKCGGFLIYYILLCTFCYIKLGMFSLRTKFSKNIFIVLVPNPMAPTKFLSKLLTSKALMWLKIVKHFLWFEMFTYNLQARV